MARTLTNNKKGVSMAEMIAYVALYGVIMSLLASLVFVIVTSARKINRQSILNRGSAILYTELLSQIIALNPDVVEDVVTSEDGNTISIEFQKKYTYNDDGDRILIDDTMPEYQDKPVKIKYIYTKNTDNIVVIYTMLDGATNNSAISLDYGMTITSVNSDEITDVFKVDTQNSSNKYVTMNAYLNFDKKHIEFNFVIPVFVARDED